MADDEAMDILLGTLDVLVLRTLAGRTMHGYAVARSIRETSNGTLRVLDGALYTALHRLEERGAVESEWGHSEQGKRAKFYRLTPVGRRELRAEVARWERYAAGMAAVLGATPRPT